MSVFHASLRMSSPDTRYARSSRKAGRGLENGQLLRRAAGSFAAFLTVDKHIDKHERIPAGLAVVTLRARSNRIQALRPLVPEIIEVLGALEPGRFYRVGV